MKNGTGHKPGQPAEPTMEERLGPEINEALLALDELALDDPEEALTTFDSLPEPVQSLVDFQLLVARAHQALGQLDAARDILTALLGEHQDNADVHHQLGDVFEDLGQLDQGNEHFERTRSLDLASFECLPFDVRKKGTVELEEALTQVASMLSERNLKFKVETLPSSADVIAGIDPRALCHCEMTDHCLTAYAANFVSEFGDIADEEERRRAFAIGVLKYASEDLGLSMDEREQFGLELLDEDEA